MILIEDKMNGFQTYRKLLVLLILVSIMLPLNIAAQGSLPVGVDSVVITFSNIPTQFTIEKAPLKYNKDFALSFQMDDAIVDIYDIVYPLFEGDGNSGGLYYSNGCGDDISFKMSSGIYIFTTSGTDLLDPDDPYHDPNRLTWESLNILYQSGWGILNHGVFNQPQAGSDEDRDYEIQRTQSYSRRKVDTSFLMKTFVIPNNIMQFVNNVFENNYHNIIDQEGQNDWLNADDSGINIENDTINWLHPKKINRLFDAYYSLSNTADLLYQTSLLDIYKWIPWGMHEYPSSFTADFQYIYNTYGSPGLDNVLITTEDDIVDYLAVKQETQIITTQNGNKVTITFGGNIPGDRLHYDLSLNVSSDQTISNIEVYGTESSSNSGFGNDTALINLSWEGSNYYSSEYMADSMTLVASSSQTQYDAWVAMDYVITMNSGNHKDSLRQVLCNIPGVSFDEGFCDFIIDLGPDTSICAYDCDSIYAPDGFNTYTWMVADTVFDTIQNIYVCPLDTTQYILLAENEFGTATDTIIYNVIPAPLVDLGNDTTICQMDSITLYGPDTTGLDYSFEWYVADTLFDTTQNISVSPLDTTLYVLLVNSSTGCSNSDSLWVNVLPIPIFEILPADTSYVCLGDSMEFIAEGNSEGLSYLWNTGDTTQTIKVSPETGDSLYKYYVDVSNSYLCSVSDTTWLGTFAVPLVSFPYDTIETCFGEEIKLSAFVDNPLIVSNYIWYYYGNIDTTLTAINNITVYESTTIYLQIITNNDCEVWDSVFINVNQSAEILTGGDKIICTGDTTTLEVSGADYYYWIVGEDTISTEPIVDVFPQDTTKYIVVGEMENGCSAIDSVFVYTLALPQTQIVYDGNNPVCQNSVITLFAQGADTYIWNTEEIADTINLIIEAATFIELTGETTNGCVANDTLTIGVLEVIPATLSGLLPIYCENDAPELLTGTPAGGKFLGSGMVGNQFKPAAAGIGTHIIKYRFTNSESGCVSFDSATTTVYGNGSEINIGLDQTIYPSETIDLDAGAGFDSYYWSTGSNYRNITIYFGDYPPGSIIRYVVIGVINGCTSQGEVYITFADPDGVGEVENKKYLVYPNPNTGTFTVSYLEDVREFQIVIYDSHGRLILNQKVECNPDCNAKIDLPKLPNGLYLIKTTSEKGVSSGKIIVR